MDKKRPENRYAKLSIAQKAKYYGEERNQRRREQYAENTDYRTGVLRRNRDAYVKKRGADAKDKKPSEHMIKHRLKEKLMRRREKGPIIGLYNVIKRPELSAALRVSTTTMMRWLKAGMFPAPELYEVLDEESGSIDRRVMYYTSEEAKVLYKVYKDHVAEFLQYSENHTDTKAAFFKGIEEVRKNWRK